MSKKDEVICTQKKLYQQISDVKKKILVVTIKH